MFVGASVWLCWCACVYVGARVVAHLGACGFLCVSVCWRVCVRVCACVCVCGCVGACVGA